jgi:hypothetical protein
MHQNLPFMLDSASVNSISSMPSPVYQCKKALRRNMAVNCSEIRLKSSCEPESISIAALSRRFRTASPYLDGSGVADERGGHLEAARRNVADGRLDVVGNPLDEVGGVLVLDVQHLLVHLLHGHAASEDRGHGQVPAVTRIARGHHVLGVEPAKTCSIVSHSIDVQITSAASTRAP